MKYFLLGTLLLAGTHVLQAQKERLFVGIEPGGYALKSFYQPNSSHPVDFFFYTWSYKPSLDFIVSFRLNKKFTIYSGHNLVNFTDSYNLTFPNRGFLKNGRGRWGYTLHQYPLLLGYSIVIADRPKFTLSFIPRAGIYYSRTSNVDLNSGQLSTIIINQATGDTIVSSSPDGHSSLYTRNSFLPAVSLGFELQYFNRKNKIRKIQINFTYAKGLTKLHEHVIGRFNPVRISSRGTFFQLSISQQFALVDLIGRKRRQRIQSRYLDGGWYKVFYLK